MLFSPKNPPTLIYLLLLALFVASVFVISCLTAIEFEQIAVPAGDPFTYTVGFFNLMNEARLSFERYLHLLWLVISPFGPNWYWILNFFAVLLSPIIPNESYMLASANFLLFYVASAFIFFFVKSQGSSNPVSLLCALTIWICPVNYGFSTYESIPVLGLDASFFALYTSALFATLIFLFSPHKTNFALIAALITGLAVWGRGNSIPTVGLAVAFPILWKFFELKPYRNLVLSSNAIVYVIVVGGLASYFYFSNFDSLSSYYQNHQTFFERHKWNLNDAQKWLLNIPGFLFWRAENSKLTICLSFFCHFFMLWILLRSFLAKSYSVSRVETARLLAATGTFIYFTQFFVNIFFFTDPLFSLQNVLLIYRPMVLGMAVSTIALILLEKHRPLFVFRPFGIVSFCGLLLVVSAFFTFQQTPWDRSKGYISPIAVEKFALDIKNRIGEGAFNILYLL